MPHFVTGTKEESPPPGPLSLESAFALVDEVNKSRKSGSRDESLEKRLSKATNVFVAREDEPIHNTLLDSWRGTPPSFEARMAARRSQPPPLPEGDAWSRSWGMRNGLGRGQ